jgi:hypothetical protein
LDPDVGISLLVLKALAGASRKAARYVELYERIIGNLCAIIGTTPWDGHSTSSLNVTMIDHEPHDDGERAMAFVAENAGLAPLGDGEWELDSHAVLLVDELLAATISLGGGLNGGMNLPLRRD